MKQLSYYISIPLAVVLLFILFNGCKQPNDNSKYLQKVLSNLEQIKSATYFSTETAYLPYDTVSMYGDLHYYFKWFDNPADTSVGASFVKLYKEDTTKMQFAYDGDVRVLVYDETKSMTIDNFENNRWPFRVVYPPFISRAKSIIHFAYETKDSVLIESKDFGDHIKFVFSIYDHSLEFVGKIPVYETPYGSMNGEISKYEIWVDKSNMLPFKIVRDLPKSKSIDVVKFITLNKLKIEDFKISDYFLADYKLKRYGKPGRDAKSEMEGKKAPGWLLESTNNNIIDFKDLKNKVLLIEFTGVGCGPCQRAIPFLNELASDYESKNFELISIETWDSNIERIKKHQDKNNISYRYLKSDKKVQSDYKVSSVPVFFILDENRIIRKVINGYGKGTTDQEIRKAINELI